MIATNTISALDGRYCAKSHGGGWTMTLFFARLFQRITVYFVARAEKQARKRRSF